MEITKVQINSLLIYYASLLKLYGEAKGNPERQRNISGAVNALEYTFEVLGIDYTGDLKNLVR